MRAFPLEYRFRFALHAIIYFIGFSCPWLYPPFTPAGEPVARTLSEPSWLSLSTEMFRAGWLGYDTAVVVLLLVALVFFAAGAWLRVWGSAYIGSGVVASHRMHSVSLLADGPFRRTRNPLYLGTLLHTIGLALLMPPSGALVAIVLIWILQVRLALAEEPFLATRFGEPYVAYRKAVPRFLPSLRPRVPAAGQRPHWLQSILGELYFVLAFLVMATLGWGYDKTTLRRAFLISLGLWLVARAFLPAPAGETTELTVPETATPEQ